MITVINKEISKKHCKTYNNDMINSAQRSEAKFSDYIFKDWVRINLVNNPDKSILERGDRRGKEIMVHCGKCKYFILVKKRSGWGRAVSQEAGKGVRGNITNTLVHHVCHEEFRLSLEVRLQEPLQNFKQGWILILDRWIWLQFRG